MNKEEKLLLELKHFKYDVLQKITDLEKIIGKPIEPKKSFKSISSKYLSNAENFRLFAINEIKTLGEPMHLNDILDKAKEKKQPNSYLHQYLNRLLKIHMPHPEKSMLKNKHHKCQKYQPKH